MSQDNTQPPTTDSTHPGYQRQQEMFLASLELATGHLERLETRDFTVWAFAYVSAIESRELRHAALDGVLAALEDRDGAE